jgi:hypothetical protein
MLEVGPKLRVGGARLGDHEYTGEQGCPPQTR